MVLTSNQGSETNDSFFEEMMTFFNKLTSKKSFFISSMILTHLVCKLQHLRFKLLFVAVECVSRVKTSSLYDDYRRICRRQLPFINDMLGLLEKKKQRNNSYLTAKISTKKFLQV